MSSQDEYLSGLLNEKNMEEQSLQDAAMGENETSAMTEEEIEMILAANKRKEKTYPDSLPESNLMELMENDDSQAIGDIHEMLQKDENNEAITEDVFFSIGEDAADKRLEDIYHQEEGASKKQSKWQERKKLREEKKREKLARKQNKRKVKASKKKGRRDYYEKEEENEEIDLEYEALIEVINNAKKEEEDQGEELLQGEVEEREQKREPIDETDEIFANMYELEGLESDASQTEDNHLTNFSELGKEEPLLEEFLPLTTESIEESVNAEAVGEKQNAVKKGFWARLVDFLSEEDEETEEREQIKLSDENEEILKELDQGKKKKKGKKNVSQKNSEEDSEEQNQKEAKGKKEKKHKKPKKEKAPKLKPVDDASGKKLSSKSVMLVFIVCISMGMAIIVLGNVGMDYSDKKMAAAAFNRQDYETCYQNLVGKNLNESQTIMFGKSESILRIQFWMREYEILLEEDDEIKALDSLLQSVHDYPKLHEFSKEHNACAEVEEIYARMIGILKERYHISEEEAREITQEPNDIEYTKKVKELLLRKEKKAGEESSFSDNMEDRLAEEAEIDTTEFIDNIE